MQNHPIDGVSALLAARRGPLNRLRPSARSAGISMIALALGLAVASWTTTANAAHSKPNEVDCPKLTDESPSAGADDQIRVEDGTCELQVLSDADLDKDPASGGSGGGGPGGGDDGGGDPGGGDPGGGDPGGGGPGGGGGDDGGGGDPGGGGSSASGGSSAAGDHIKTGEGAADAGSGAIGAGQGAIGAGQGAIGAGLGGSGGDGKPGGHGTGKP